MICRVCGSEAGLYDTIRDNIYNVTGFYNMPVEKIKADIKIYRCSGCGHIQTESCLNESYYSNYNIIYKPEPGKDSGYPEKLMNYYLSCFEKMRNLSVENSSVLDIGCAAGDMLSILSGMYNYCMGIEPSGRLSRAAENRGFNVINGFFGNNSVFDRKFDSMTCLMVLEHIENLIGFMESAYNNLNDNGVILINVPNGQKIFNTASYNDIFPEHINYFTPQSLTELAYRSSFEILNLEEGFGNGFHLTVWLKKSLPFGLFSEKKKADKKLLNDIISGYNRIGIFGIGVRARNILNMIEDETSIRYLFDNNPSLNGKYIAGMKEAVKSPSRETVNECDLILITSSEYYDDIIIELKELDFSGNIVYLQDGTYTLLTERR